LNLPSPAIVPRAAVKRLPRWALWLFCGVYILAGFLGRDPWKSADITAFGAMQELALGQASWWAPQDAADHGGYDSLLPFWLGAAAIKSLPFLDPGLASRLPFMGLLALSLAATWYAVYHLARSPQAQPVAFAFGGEADSRDYARALADAALLALLACLGLAQLSHETTPALAQLGFSALLLYALVAPVHQGRTVLAALALAGLALSGAPNIALMLGLGACLIAVRRPPTGESAPNEARWAWPITLLALTAASVWLAWLLGLWHWRIDMEPWGQAARQKSLSAVIRLFVWFMWPAWPLALWTLWQWRRQLGSQHIALPLWFVLVISVSTLLTTASDRGLLLALPALAALAAFALPTLKRSVSALIDWFTLIFFTICGITIWVVWIALQTGVPAKPAANVARLAPGFEPSFSGLALLVALLATLGWAWLVKWRTGRHRSALWKSLVLPAGGATLCWLLLMSLWLPLLDHARGYQPLVQQVLFRVDRAACIETLGLSTAQITALRYHGQLQLQNARPQPQCPALLVDRQAQGRFKQELDTSAWTLVAAARRPTEKSDDMLIYRRTPPARPEDRARE
jgi:4-amino-4-deoxy-L-arabinose transferase-like glycosyltransferase